MCKSIVSSKVCIVGEGGQARAPTPPSPPHKRLQISPISSAITFFGPTTTLN